MTFVAGLLALGDTGFGGSQFMAASVSAIGDDREHGAHEATDPAEAPLDTERWRGIVVHHLGMPAGDAEYVHRLHLGYGYQGLGYHFLIGNGNGLGDGVVQVGYRWHQQLPGAHVIGPAGEEHNRHSIGICLIGNGDRRPFTDKQMASLTALVQQLQSRLDLPADAIRLHRELVTGVSSPGELFAAARFHDALLD